MNMSLAFTSQERDPEDISDIFLESSTKFAVTTQKQIVLEMLSRGIENTQLSPTPFPTPFLLYHRITE